MNTQEINVALQRENCFLGVFASDKLPPIGSKPAALVINTDPSDKPGEHWVAIYYNTQGNAEYFDSFGLPPLTQAIVHHLQRNSNHWHYNNHLLQHPTSNTCGKYCIIFVRLRCRGYSFCSIVNFFSKIPKYNDMLVDSIK